MANITVWRKLEKGIAVSADHKATVGRILVVVEKEAMVYCSYQGYTLAGHGKNSTVCKCCEYTFWREVS